MYADMRPPDPPAAWWKTAVVYQVYIRSFADANGDGVGDIAGIVGHLGYLRDLGVDAIWITPWYPSPMADGGYDVADYRAIGRLFGTLGDARDLVGDAHALGLRVIIDIVPNHTSAEHPWFREALTAGRGSVARARYIFRDGRGPGGSEPPNNWSSILGLSAWTEAPDDGEAPRQWYLHLFDRSQPDLDWNNPEVRTEFESIIEFWLDFGIDGFRIDVASFLVKAPGLPDFRSAAIDDPTAATKPRPHPFMDLEAVHEIYRSWRKIVDRHGGGAMFCGEIALPAARIATYLRPDELHTAFNLDFAQRPWDADEFRASIDATLASHSAVGAPATWVIGNHDLPRPVFRYGRTTSGVAWNAWEHRAESDQSLGRARARAAAILYLALPGSAYIYQGDELGLAEVVDLPDEVRQDPAFLRTDGAELGRDGCRVPFPWEDDAPPFGFGPPGSLPWLPQPREWAAFTVDAETRDPASTLELYRAALRIRRSSPELAGETFRWLPSPRGTLLFSRGGGFRCAVNLSGAAMPLPEMASVLLTSRPIHGGALAPEAAAWFEVPRRPFERHGDE